MRVGGAAALDRRQRVEHALRQLAGAAAADGEATGRFHHLADRGHDRGGAAGEGFGQAAARGVGAPLVDAIGLFAHRQALVAGDADDRIAGDAGQNRAGQRRGDHRSVVEHEEDVHAAQFLDPATLDRVEEHDLVAPLRDRLRLRGEAGGVIAAALRLARTAGRGARVILADPDRHRARAALPIGADRGCDDHVEIFGGGLHAQERFARIHEGAQVQRAAVDLGKPVALGPDQLAARFEEQFFGQFGHREAARTVVEPARIGVGPEQRHAAVIQAIGLQPFENLLRIMQHRGGGIDRHRRARGDDGVVPALPLGVADHRHMVGEDAAEPRIDQPRRALVGVHRRGAGIEAKSGRPGRRRRIHLISLRHQGLQTRRDGG